MSNTQKPINQFQAAVRRAYVAHRPFSRCRCERQESSAFLPHHQGRWRPRPKSSSSREHPALSASEVLPFRFCSSASEELLVFTAHFSAGWWIQGVSDPSLLICLKAMSVITNQTNLWWDMMWHKSVYIHKIDFLHVLQAPCPGAGCLVRYLIFVQLRKYVFKKNIGVKNKLRVRLYHIVLHCHNKDGSVSFSKQRWSLGVH